LVCDLLHFERDVPSFPHYREFQLCEVEAIRRACATRISWAVIFLKAFSLVSQESPVLRQTLIRYPWPYLYQHPFSVGYLAIRRQWEEEEWLFFGSFPKADSVSLQQLQGRLDNFIEQPVTRVFRLQLRAAGLPALVRRSVMWVWLNWMGRRRAKRVGTFGLTTISGQGAVIQFPPGLQTSTLTYGPVDESGRTRVTMNYDHRLMDGWYVAEVLREMEEAICGPIAQELQALGETGN